MAAIDAQADESHTAKSRLDELYDELTDQATKMARLLGAVDEVAATIRVSNRQFADIGRPDLKVKYTDPQIVRQRAREYLR